MLVAPLDWGLGHATRCIPIIETLLEEGAEVIVMGSRQVCERVKQAFPQLKYQQEDLYVPVYSRILPAWAKIAVQLPKLLYSEQMSYARLQMLVKQEKIDLIISDNRYYCYSDTCLNILITHQLNPLPPACFSFSRTLVEKKIADLCDGFDEIWIPDVNKNRPLSGKLSMNKRLTKKIKFCGILSRFAPDAIVQEQRNYDLLILSGPAPQPEALYLHVSQLYANSNRELKVISYYNLPEKSRVRIYMQPDQIEFEELIVHASNIICRSGYSTIMDLLTLNKRALLIPTPGQTEQEYLSKHLIKEGFSRLNQSQLQHLKNPEEIPFPKEVTAITNEWNSVDLKALIKNLLNQIE